ncbi:hypothetical protein HGK72_27110 [Mycolicibacterium fortuitum]|uniref:hypothetical protein n=1 Tax=Mycolicibacterium fortuitum TaxID=1766 RepID=UPI00148FB0D6|nr:hypothetical protein [Mycolicibacterium fortuitum]
MSRRGKRGASIGALGVVLTTIAGLCLVFVPVNERDGAGYSLRCGTVLNRDEGAAQRYQLEQFRRITTLIGEYDGSVIPPGSLGPNDGILAPTPAIGTRLQGPADLEQKCAKSLAALRTWFVALAILGVLVIALGVVVGVPKLTDVARQLTNGARFPTWMRKCPDWIQAALVSAAGLTGAFTGITTDGWRVFWIAASIAILVFAISLSIARSAENARRDLKLSELMADHKAETQHLVGNELHSLIQITAEAVATENRAERHGAARGARAALMSAAAHLVGAVGTRANLFELSSDGQQMTLAPGGFAGRGTRSRRTFTAGHKTFDLTKAEQGRFVRSAKDELVGSEKDVPYQTFMTYPVSVGPSRVHGVLTVDSLNTGDLDEDRDTPIMAVLSALIAVTYECEKYDNAVI